MALTAHERSNLKTLFEAVLDDSVSPPRLRVNHSATLDVNLDAANDSVQVFGLEGGSTITAIKVNTDGELVVDTTGGQFKDSTKLLSTITNTFKIHTLTAGTVSIVVENIAEEEMEVAMEDEAIGVSLLKAEKSAAGRFTFVDRHGFDVDGHTQIKVKALNAGSFAVKILETIKV